MREKMQGFFLHLRHILEKLAYWLVLAIFIVVATHLIYLTATFPVNLSFLVIFGLISLSQRLVEIRISILPEPFYSNIWIRSILVGLLVGISWLVINRLLNLDVVLFVWNSGFTFALLCVLALIFLLLFLLNHYSKLADLLYTRSFS